MAQRVLELGHHSDAGLTNNAHRLIGKTPSDRVASLAASAIEDPVLNAGFPSRGSRKRRRSGRSAKRTPWQGSGPLLAVGVGQPCVEVYSVLAAFATAAGRDPL